MKRKLGVIGGLGTDTAAKFYIDAERMWHAAGEPNHIPLMIENIQSPFSLEQSLTKTMARVKELKDFLCQAAKSLEQGGATMVVLPCNTAHVHIEAVRNTISIPMLSITEETAVKLSTYKIKVAAILGTRVTRLSKIYDQECNRAGVNALYPSESDQLIVEKIIQRALSWKNNESDTKQLLRVIDNAIKQGADGVVLACTDLQLCMPGKSPDFVFDSMETLAEASVKRLLET
ncbi:MAG: amino acid racemase [Patescibacteria group bacterium]